MHLSGLHILLTYKCVYECDHCFIWGSPRQSGVFTLEQLDDVLQQAISLGTVREIFFAGGETFVYYPILIEAIRRATALQFETVLVTNGYWATSYEQAYSWLKRLVDAGLHRVELSFAAIRRAGATTDTYSGLVAARSLGLETVVRHQETLLFRDENDSGATFKFRGRAAARLTRGLPRHSWPTFSVCPSTELALPGRLYVDPYGNAHLCPGLTIGNLFERPLDQLVAEYRPEAHPVVGPLLAGGPAELVRRYQLNHDWGYVDACHLCYSVRDSLRTRFPTLLGPDQMYGVPEGT